MKKVLLTVTSAAIIISTSVQATASQRQISPPLPAPTRGVSVPLVQLPPVAAFDLFAQDLRNSLQEGMVPDISLFRTAAHVYDGNYDGLYPEFLSALHNHYLKTTRNYISNARSAGLPQPQLQAAYRIIDATSKQADKMANDAIQSDRARVESEKKVVQAAYEKAMGEFAKYKGNPSTLSMPSKLFSPVPPGAVISSDLLDTERLVLEIATTQMSLLRDRLGSGTPRSNQWLQLLRSYHQARINRDAVIQTLGNVFEYPSSTIPNF